MENTPNNPETQEQKDSTLAQEIRLKIAAVAAKVASDDRKRLNDILTKARSGVRDSAMCKFTAPMAAILFLEHNPHNRDWAASYTVELARQMELGLWQWNNATVGFYVDGAVEDGQHRYGAAALANFMLETTVVFGIERPAIVTVDAGKARYARDAAKLDGVENATVKEAIVKTVANYMVRSGNKSRELRSRPEIKQAIETNNLLLNLSIEIGKASRRGIASPIFKDKDAATIAYLMLTTDWPEDRVREKLSYFQTGQAMEGEGDNSPCFLAAKLVSDAHARENKRVKLTVLKEIGVAMWAMVQSELGVKAVRKAQLLEAVKKGLPDAHFPVPVAQAA